MENYISPIYPDQFKYFFLISKSQITSSFLADIKAKTITDYEGTPETHPC
jgi:hypothetical protein